ncbi:ISNCY family transposase [uncultured Fretibacterium sp.]|uniref:ISNCY family transposase n=1 Tax=uncultured Fretibacterium sp. TaxID=1678694 RepID=UPI00325F9FFA
MPRVDVSDRHSICGLQPQRAGRLLMGLCRRQIIRLRKKYTAQGEMGLIHGNRDRRPQHRIGEWIRHDVLRLYREKYHDFNFSHFTDCLKEAEGIDISRSSVVRILSAEGFRSKKSVRRRAKLHRARPRKEAAGMLWQTDASKFEWFGKGKGYATLHAYIDDATGRVVGAWFTKNESTAGYVTALGIGLEHYGLPMEIYSDRHTIFRSPQELSEEEKEEGKQRPLSNFGQGLKELGVGQIFALTPEAKGRVERLWNTMQDRLPGELRLLGVTDIDGANNVLPRLIAKHNEKFAVLPAEQESAYVEPAERVDVDFLFAHREMRKTDCSGSISYKGRTYAPSSPEKASMARSDVEVRETLSGKIWAVYKSRRIELKEVEKAERAAPSYATKENKGKPLKAYKPAPDHPWKQSFRKNGLSTPAQSDSRVTLSLNT